MSEANKGVFRNVILWAVLTLGGYLLFRYDLLWVTCLMWSGYFCAVMDTLQHHFADSYFNRLNPKFWNPAMSWTNKWKNRSGGYEVGNERFLGSSTIFVFITDAWHLSKFLMMKCIAFTILFYHPLINFWMDFVLILAIFGTVFSTYYFLYKRGK